MKLDWLAPIKEDIDKVEGSFNFSESGESFELDMGGLYYGYKGGDLSDADVQDILGADFEGQDDFAEKYLQKNYPDAYEGWIENEDDYYNIGDFLREWEGWSVEVEDNTYNSAYLGPMTVDFKIIVDPDGQKFAMWKNHHGGDVRGNYGLWHFVEIDDTYDFIIMFSGGASFYVNFNDGSQLYIDSETDSDVWYLRADSQMEWNGNNNLAEKWGNLIRENAGDDWNDTEEIFEAILSDYS